MKLLARWKTTIVSSFEHVLNQVENHDATIATAIQEGREAAAGARVKLNRIRRDGERMRSRISERNESAQTWASRAVQVHGSDPGKALECVRRRNLARTEAQHLEAELTSHREIEQQLQRDLVEIETRIAELGRRRNAYSAREFRAKALGAAQACSVATQAESVEEVFDRWEMKLASTEPLGAATIDPLESTFAAAEKRAALEAELDELLRDPSRAAS
jgi:phage shock protein A